MNVFESWGSGPLALDLVLLGFLRLVSLWALLVLVATNLTKI